MTQSRRSPKPHHTKGRRWRLWHRFVAPILLIPLGLTTLTGAVYQGAELMGIADQALWLLDLHKGVFGPFDFQRLYPFVNALGFLLLAGTGIAILVKGPRFAHSRGHQ